MTLEGAIQYCLSGITVGSIYAIVGIGFNITYNATGIINFAQGEFVVLGAMIATSLAGSMPLAAAIAAAVAATAAIGALVDLLFIRRVQEPTILRLIIVTIGVSILLREGVHQVWGDGVRSLPFFTGTEVSSIPVLGAHISPQILWVLGICAGLVAGLGIFFKYTLAGRAMRACAANRAAARLCGIDVRGMVTLSFLLSAGTGALAGCVISPITQTQCDMGAPLAIKGFTVAVLGGLGNVAAAVWAGLILGLLEAFSIVKLPFLGWGLPVAYQDAVSIAVLLGVLVLRPNGLFGSRQASAG